MGALPKNKISRVERGKRRHGNTPKLKKDLNSATPKHKQGFTAEFLRFIGLAPRPTSQAEVKKAAPVKKATTESQAGQVAAKARPVRQTAGGVKTTRKTQHKG